MSEENKIIKYLESQGYENSVIGTVLTPSHSVTNDPYHMSVGKVTVASCMVQYIDSTRQSPESKKIEEALEYINKGIAIQKKELTIIPLTKLKSILEGGE